MAGLPIINGIQRVAFTWKLASGGTTAVNVMHFSTASTDTLALKNLLNSSVTNGMWGHTANGTAIYQLAITPLDGLSATQIYTVSGSNWTAAAGSGDYSPATAVVVSLRTAVRGRQNRGRVYLPFPLEANIANGVLVSNAATMQTAWDAFRAAMKAGLMPMHVASYGHGLHKSGGHGGPVTYTPVTWTPHSNEVVTTTVETALGTLRPRQSRLRP